MVFYFIINENLGREHPLRKIAVAYDESSINPYGYGKVIVSSPHSIWNVLDEKIKMDEVREAIEENVLGERYLDLKNLWFKDDDSLSTDPPTAEELISFKREGVEGLDELIKTVNSRPLNEDELIELSNVLEESGMELVDQIMDEIFTEIRDDLEVNPPSEGQEKLFQKILEEYIGKMQHVDINYNFDGEYIFFGALLGIELGAD